MEKVIKLIILACLFACSHEEPKKHLHMTLSNSLPIQFWLNGQETYNEKDVCGITKVCFCQPFECADQIKLQFSDIGSTSVKDYNLSIYEGDTMLTTIPFDKYTSPTPTQGALSTGSNESSLGAGLSWTTGSSPNVALNNSNLVSKYFKIPITNGRPGDLSFVFHHTIGITGSGGSFNGKMTFYLFNSDFSESAIYNAIGDSGFPGLYVGAGAKTEHPTFSPSFTPAYFVIKMELIGSGGYTWTTTINSSAIENVTYNSVYSISFIGSDYDLCNKSVLFQIDEATFNIIETQYSIDEFVSDMEGWTSGTTPAFVWSADNSGSLKVTMTGDDLPTVINNPSGTPFQPFRIKITWTSSVYSAPAPIKLLAVVYDAATSLLQSSTFSDAGGTNVSTITISDPEVYNNATQIWLQMFRDTSGGSFDIHINSVEILTTEIETDLTEIGQSDCVNFKTTHPCTIPILYSNNSDFDGIDFALQSPDLSFLLRIPAVFFHEENTEEQEDIELSNDEIVRLYNKIEEKRNLQIGFMPHYMHRKLQLALSHDFVMIDGKEWIKRDEYKKNDGDRHYPLKTASVLLTDKNFIKENQL